MPTVEQMVQSEMATFRDLARSGVTERTGKGIRQYGSEGAIIGRHGGLKPTFPGLAHVKQTPKVIAAAIDRGKGKTYRAVYSALEKYFENKGFRHQQKARASRALKVLPHAGRSYCAHCRTAHSKGQHRFHGEGSFHGTHLFSFNPGGKGNRYVIRWKPRAYSQLFSTKAAAVAYLKRTLKRSGSATVSTSSRTTRRRLPNPPGRKIYGRVLSIQAQKTDSHPCDAECKRANHCYVHDFKAGAVMYGLPDGSLLIRKER